MQLLTALFITDFAEGARVALPPLSPTHRCMLVEFAAMAAASTAARPAAPEMKQRVHCALLGGLAVVNEGLLRALGVAAAISEGAHAALSNLEAQLVLALADAVVLGAVAERAVGQTSEGLKAEASAAEAAVADVRKSTANLAAELQEIRIQFFAGATVAGMSASGASTKATRCACGAWSELRTRCSTAMAIGGLPYLLTTTRGMVA